MIVLPIEKKIDWKRPPVILLVLVLLNVLVFAFYQSGDASVMQEAYTSYDDANLVEIEADAFDAYQQTLEFDQRVPTDDADVAWYMMMDDDFSTFLEENHSRYIDPEIRSQWKNSRESVQRQLDKISYLAKGLNTSRISPLTLITHQFLHGDILHLLGNMVFLVITGFAVEAALGHGRFLAYYLISGICAGLLFVGFHKFTNMGGQSLVGASGAISGVMAMYLALFKTRKIEFFYWLFIFTGYFRAAAIIILPAYIFKELAMQVMYADSNVAYTAHIGGFLSGLALVLFTQSLNHKVIDVDYLDDVQAPVDPYRNDLNKLYQEIASCEFRKAWTALKLIKKEYPAKPELRDIEFNLVLALNQKKANEYLIDQLDKAPASPHIIKAQITAWQRLETKQQSQLPFSKKSALISNCLSVDLAQIASKVFSGMKLEEGFESEMASLAHRIGVHYQNLGRADIAEEHNAIAKKIMESAR